MPTLTALLWICAGLIYCCQSFGHGSHHFHDRESPHYDLASPIGWVNLDWPFTGVSNSYTAGYGDALGVASFFRRQPHQWHSIDDRRCLTTNFLALDIDDSTHFDTEQDFELELLIDTGRSGDLVIGYDRNHQQRLLTLPLPRQEQGLNTVSIRLDKARLANRGTGQSDIALVTRATFFPPTPALDAQPATFTLCDLRLTPRHRANLSAANHGSLSVTINTNDGQALQPTPVRIGLYQLNEQQQLRSVLPNDQALLLDFYQQPQRLLQLRRTEAQRHWPAENPFTFYINGSYQQSLAPGRYRLVATKGPEFEPLIETFEIHPHQRTTLELTLQRWINMPRRGWLSGDVHIHIPRDENNTHNIQQWMQAEDLHLGNLVEMHNPGGRYFRQSGFGKNAIAVNTDLPQKHWLVPGVEGPRTAQRGHTLALNIQRLANPAKADLLYHHYLSAYQQQKAVTGYAHVGSKEFNASLGLALDTPFALVDFVEILQNGQLRTEFWYQLLNLGFKLAPAAGSDYPYFDQPGAVRSYVRLDTSPESMTHSDWFSGLKRGATFVTNGPMLDFTINTHSPGAVISVDNAPASLNASAMIDPNRDRLKQLEVIYCGEVIDSRSDDDLATASVWQLKTHIKLDKPGWYALRATSEKGLRAHTGAIYLQDDHANHWCESHVQDGIALQLQRLQQLQDWVVDLSRELEFWQVGSLEYAARQQHHALKHRIQQARTWYHQRLSAFSALNEPN